MKLYFVAVKHKSEPGCYFETGIYYILADSADDAVAEVAEEFTLSCEDFTDTKKGLLETFAEIRICERELSEIELPFLIGSDSSFEWWKSDKKEYAVYSLI